MTSPLIKKMLAALLRDVSNLRAALRAADEQFNPSKCLGCGRDRDETHKADCLIYPAVNGVPVEPKDPST